MVLEVEQKGSMGSVVVLVKTFVTQVEKILVFDITILKIDKFMFIDFMSQNWYVNLSSKGMLVGECKNYGIQTF